MLPKKKRVAAYCRVSTGKDAMLHSLSAQISYYSKLIQSHADWLYCGVYADEGISGTKNDRDEFLRMLNDCRAGCRRPCPPRPAPLFGSLSCASHSTSSN